ARLLAKDSSQAIAPSRALLQGAAPLGASDLALRIFGPRAYAARHDHSLFRSAVDVRRQGRDRAARERPPVRARDGAVRERARLRAEAPRGAPGQPEA